MTLAGQIGLAAPTLSTTQSRPYAASTTNTHAHERCPAG
jgi:hypothetical protein